MSTIETAPKCRDALAFKVCLYFARQPAADLTSAEIAKLFGARRAHVAGKLRDIVANEMVLVTRDREEARAGRPMNSYRAGPALIACMKVIA